MGIHLNIALCSLKREDWYLARKASEYAIEYDGFVSQHAMESLDDLSAASDSVASLRPKALYRLAQVLREGRDDRVCKTSQCEKQKGWPLTDDARSQFIHESLFAKLMRSPCARSQG